MEQLIYNQVGAPVVKFIAGHITKHLGYATCSTKHVKNMLERMNILEGKSEGVTELMNRNKENNKYIPARVPAWLGEVENVKKEVESVASNDSGCLHMKNRYRAGEKAVKIIKEIESLINEEKDIKWSDDTKPLGRVPSKNPYGEISQNELKSRDKIFKEALKFLEQDDKVTQAIALCGMGGVGKTFMMEQLKEDAEKKKMFDYIVKVVIGQNVNIRSIQTDIGEYIGVPLRDEASDSVRADQLYRKFVNLSDTKKKILVIFDDVWKRIELKDIGLRSPFPDGVKVLLTSRVSDICTQIADDANLVLKVVNVDILEEAEAHSFFCRLTGVLEDDDLFHIGRDIVKKCGRLPLAIKLIAPTLKSKEDYVWRNTLKLLQNNGLIEDVQTAIKISYDFIKDEDKQIFLLCGLFPEDTNILIEILTRYAWGLKLFKNLSTLRDVRDQTNTCVGNLIKANLLINSDHDGRVKMHDLVLAFVLDTVSKPDHSWIINHGDASNWDKDDIGESCTRISLTCTSMSEIPKGFKYPNLTFIQLMNGDDQSLKFPENFYENMKKLEVIAYHNMYYPLLPRSLQCSTNLKSLSLYDCKMMFDISFIGDLVNLEVLTLAHCGIRKLPSRIGNLIKLKLLDLSGCVDLHIDDGVFINLVNLEELYMSVSHGKAIRFTNGIFEELKMLSSKLHALEVEFVEMNTQLENLSFTQLDKFKISMGCLLEKEEDKEKYLFKTTLKLVIEHGIDVLDFKINELINKTEKLHLQVKDMVSLEYVSVHPYDQHSFSSLRDLEVSHCEELKYMFPINVAVGMRKLERLKISSCSVLKALVHNDGSEINREREMIKFEKLKVLSLKDLPELECLFLIDNVVVELPQLVELDVDWLPNFTSIYSNTNNSSALFNSQVRIPELKKLRIICMQNLEQIWAVSNPCSVEEVNNISNLREIFVWSCHSLVDLFPTNPMRLLNHLDSLFVYSCSSIEVIFNVDMDCIDDVKLVTNSRLRDIRVYNSENVREVWRIKGGDNNSSLPIRGFEAVKTIYIYNCMMFRNVFTPTNTKFNMPSIIYIDIGGLRFTYRQEKENWFIGSKERDDSISSVAFPSNLMSSFCHLQGLSIGGDDSVEVVFEIVSSTSSRELVTATNNQQPLLPDLQYLSLEGMKSMTHVWKCSNWNEFLIPKNQSSFHNLTKIEIYYCQNISYLFSPLMAKHLSNLKSISIRRCDGMEEVVSNRDDKDKEMTTPTNNFFPNLHSLTLEDLTILKRIGGGGGGGAKSTSSIIPDQFESSLDTVVPWSLCQYSSKICIDKCGSLVEVFETQAIYNKNKSNSVGGITSTTTNERNGATYNTSLSIPRQESIYVPKLFKLKKLEITSCNLLQHLFTFSTLQSLKQLEELIIRECNEMKVIVKEENEEQRKDVVFPHLESLELINLPNLRGFFFGMNDFQWPLLEMVVISECPKLEVFTSQRSTTPKLKYIHTALGKYSLENGLNFHVTTLHQTRSLYNLIELRMEDNSDSRVKSIIPFNELIQLQKLEMIRVSNCSDVEEIFEVEEMEGTDSDSQIVVETQNLKQVKLRKLDKLKYIWKSKHRARTKLMFSNLTTLYIHDCKSLQYVFTSSMVDSLLQLQDLHISKCPNMEVIVKEEEESECDAIVNQIVMLPRLMSLKFKGLQCLKGFWLGKDDFTWPLLHTLKIIECPEITVFTKGHVATPALSVIDTSFGRCDIREDINSFIKTKQNEGFSFALGEDHLDYSEEEYGFWRIIM